MAQNAIISVRLGQVCDARDHATLIGDVIASATAITNANVSLIAQAVFEELMKPAEERDEARVARYMAVALKARDQEIKDKSLCLAERRFQFDASKAALKESAKLQEINQTSEDEDEKIKKVTLLLFGPEPVGFSSPAEKEAA
jgi:hypothetical protein